MPSRRELQMLSSDAQSTPESSLLRRENARRLRDAVQKLPPDYRLMCCTIWRTSPTRKSPRSPACVPARSACDCTGRGCLCASSWRGALLIERPGAVRRSSRVPKYSRARAVARSCLPNFPTTWTTNSTSLCAMNWKSTSAIARLARPFCRNYNGRFRSVVRAPRQTPHSRRAAELRRQVLSLYESAMKGALAGKGASAVRAAEGV